MKKRLVREFFKESTRLIFFNFQAQVWKNRVAKIFKKPFKQES
jgi:hypothetical protein